MLVEMNLHPFIIPDKELIGKLQEMVNEGELYIYNDLAAACKYKDSVVLCFGWVNGIKEENGIYYLICRVLDEDSCFDKTLAINYANKQKEIINLYLV